MSILIIHHDQHMTSLTTELSNIGTSCHYACEIPQVSDLFNLSKPGARSIQPKFPEIPVQNSMDRFGPTGKVSKKNGPPFEVVLFSRSDRSEFWLNGSRP